MVFSDDRYGQFDIFRYDLALDSDNDGVPNYRDGDRPSPDPALARITTDASKQSNPDVSGRRLVWTDWRNEGSIYCYDLDNPVPNGTPLDPRATGQFSPRISGDWAVWADWRHGSGYNSDIYAANVVSGQVYRITSNNLMQTGPAASGGRVVWADQRGGNWDIYLREPDAIAPAATVITPSISSKTSKRAKFRVRWQAADPSGIAAYYVQRKTGAGGSWVAWKSGKAAEAVFAGKAGKTYYFRSGQRRRRQSRRLVGGKTDDRPLRRLKLDPERAPGLRRRFYERPLSELPGHSAVFDETRPVAPLPCCRR